MKSSVVKYPTLKQTTLDAIHQSATGWLTTARQYLAEHPDTISAEDRATLESIYNFLTSVSTRNLIRFADKHQSFDQRIMSASREASGRKYIEINPRAAEKLQVLLRHPEAGFIMANFLVHEVSELILEDPLENSWSDGIDVDEPWAEAFNLHLESVLWRVWFKQQHAASLEKFRNVWDLLARLLDPTWMTHYFQAVASLVGEVPLSLHRQTPESQHRVWQHIFVPFLIAGGYPSDYFGAPLKGLHYKWNWAASRFKTVWDPSDIDNVLNPWPKSILTPWRTRVAPPQSKTGRRFSPTKLSDAGMPPDSRFPLIQKVTPIAIALYRARGPETNYIELERAKRISDLYRIFATTVGLEPDPKFIATGYLFQAIESELAPLLSTVKDPSLAELLQIHRRVNAAFRIPYFPPKDAYKKDPRTSANQMALYGKSLASLDELLLLTAAEVVALEDPRVTEESKEVVYRKLEELLAPLLKRLGASALGERLIDMSFQSVEPHIYHRIETSIEEMIHLNRSQAAQHMHDLLGKIAKDIHTRIPTIPESAVRGGIKNPYSVRRKSYRTPVPKMEDLLRGSVVLNDPSQKGEVMALIGNRMTGRMTTKGYPEYKMTGYNAWHVTFTGMVGRNRVPHEFIIFETPEEYYRYAYGPDNAHWAYAESERTGRSPLYESFTIDEADLRGNFTRFQNAIEPWKYFFASGTEGTRLVFSPKRIPSPSPERGNIADAAAVLGELDAHTHNALRYRYSFNPFAEEPWKQTPPQEAHLYWTIDNGTVLRFMTGGNTRNPKDPDIEKMKRSAAHGLTLVELSKLSGEKPVELLQRGKIQFVHLLRTAIGKTWFRSRYTLPDTFRQHILVPQALAHDLRNSDMLLSLFGLPDSDSHLASLRSTLWEDIRIAIQKHGATLIRTSDEQVRLAVGSGMVSPSEVATHLNEIYRPSGLRADVPNGTSGPGKTLSFEDFNFTEIESSYQLDFTLSHDQPDILFTLVAILNAHDARLIGGSRAIPKSTGARLRFVIEKHPDLDTDNMLDHLLSAEIPVRPPVKQDVRMMSVSLEMEDNRNAFLELLEGLRAHLPDTNIPWFAFDSPKIGQQSTWLNMTLAIPIRDGESVRRTRQRIQQALKAITTKPVELSRANISPATRDQALIRLFQEPIIQNIPAAKRFIQRIARFVQWKPGNVTVGEDLDVPHENQKISAPGDDVPDKGFMDELEDALDLAKRFHSRKRPDGSMEPEFRKSGHSYVVHPIRVVIRLLKWGVRDPIILIAGLLHDVLENGPINIYISEFGEEPEDDEPKLMAYQEQILEEIGRLFPNYKHRLFYTLEYISHYRTEVYSFYAEKLGMGGVHLMALKLADMTDNLTTIYDVKDPKFASEQIAKRLRFGLPIVSAEVSDQNEVYWNSRRDFLTTLIMQSNRLKDEEFYVLHVDADRENWNQVRKETIQNIQTFLSWIDRYPQALASHIKQEEVEIFLYRLRLMDTQLAQPEDLQKRTHSTLLIQTDDPENDLTRRWFEGTALDGRFFFYPKSKYTAESLEGTLIYVDETLAERGIREIAIDFTLLADNVEKRVDGPFLKMHNPDLHLPFVRPYFPMLMRALLRWLRDEQGYDYARFVAHYGDGGNLVKLLEGMRTNPSTSPIVQFPTKESIYVKVSLHDMDLSPTAGTHRPPNIRGLLLPLFFTSHAAQYGSIPEDYASPLAAITAAILAIPLLLSAARRLSARWRVTPAPRELPRVMRASA